MTTASTKGGLSPVLAGITLSAGGVLPLLLVGAESTFERHALGLSSVVIAATIAGFFVLASSGSRLASLVRVRPDMLMRVGAVVTCVACGAVLLVGTAPVLVVALLLCGISYGSTQPAVSSYLVMHVSSGNRGAAFGFRQASVPLATLISGVVVAVIAPISWRDGYAIPVLLLSGSLLLVRRTPVSPVTTSTKRSARNSRASWSLIVIAIGLGLGAATIYVLGSFNVPYSISRGLGTGAAGALAAGGGAAALAVRLAVGIHSDRRAFNKLRVSGLMLFFGAIGYAGVALSGHLVLVIATLLAFGAGSGWNGLVLHALVERFPEQATRATGAALTAAYLGGALGPPLFELMAGWTSTQSAWLCLLAVAVVAGTLMLWAASMTRPGPLG